MTDSLRLERLQTRAARLVTGTLRRSSTDKLRRELGWDSLKTRRTIHKLTMYFTLRHPQSQLPTYITSIIPNIRLNDTGRILRNANTHTLPANRLTTFHNSFIPATTRLWNALPNHIQSEASTKSFKKALVKHFGTPPPPKFFSFGTKHGNILHTRLRIGMSHLNAHLYPQQLSESPECRCGSPSETVQHFILNCPLYQHSRDNLFQSLSILLQINVTILHSSEILNLLLNGQVLPSGSDQAVAQLFQSFIFETGRFR